LGVFNLKKIRIDRVALVLIVLFLFVSAFLVYNNYHTKNGDDNKNNIDNSFKLDDSNTKNFSKVFVDGKVFSYEDIKREYDILPFVLRQQMSFDDYVNKFFIPRTLLLVDAEKNNIVVSDDEVNASLEELKNALLQQNSSLEEYLDSNNLSLDEFLSRIKEDLLVQKDIDFVTKDINVSDDELKAVYDAFNLSSKNLTFEQSKNDLYNFVLNDKKNKFLQTYISKLEKKFNVKFE